MNTLHGDEENCKTNLVHLSSCQHMELHGKSPLAYGHVAACTGGVHCDGIRGGTAGGALYVELQYEYSTQLRRLLIISELF